MVGTSGRMSCMDETVSAELYELANARWRRAYAKWQRADPDSPDWEVQRMLVAKWAGVAQELYVEVHSQDQEVCHERRSGACEQPGKRSHG